MKERLFQAALSIRPSSIAGYGVFAEQDFKEGDLLEECHLVISDGDFINYDFSVKKRRLLPLGYGAIYNHSDDNNAKYAYDEKSELMKFKAFKPIKKGEEIFINYGQAWFKERGMEIYNPTPRLRFYNKTTVFRFILIVLFMKCFLLIIA